jgi:hypothetical protein
MSETMAFPGQPRGSDGMPCADHSPGMTLRDYFAGQALAGLMAVGNGDEAPQYAYFLADAMLAARSTK